MSWVLRVREPESGFIGQPDDGGLVIVSEPGEAREFDSEDEAQSFKMETLQSEVSSAWCSRAPQLFPVRMGPGHSSSNSGLAFFKSLGGSHSLGWFAGLMDGAVNSWENLG